MTGSPSPQGTRIAATILVALTLAACAPQSEVEAHLSDYWDGLGDGGRQQMCLVLETQGEDAFAAEFPDEYAAESVAFFVDRCADV